MILTCPKCATRYQIEGSKFPPGGRTVRCTRCSHVWLQAAPEPEPDALPLDSSRLSSAAGSGLPAAHAASAAPAAAAPPAKVRVPGERAAIAAGWIALAAIVGLVVWAGVRYRDTIASVWPQASTLYSALGLPVNARGLAFAEVNYRRETQAGQSMLIVQGTLRNTSGHDVAVPNLQVVLSDRDKRRLDSWKFSTGVGRLGPGEKLAFTTRRAEPPEDARHLEITFAPSGG